MVPVGIAASHGTNAKNSKMNEEKKRQRRTHNNTKISERFLKRKKVKSFVNAEQLSHRLVVQCGILVLYLAFSKTKRIFKMIFGICLNARNELFAYVEFVIVLQSNRINRNENVNRNSNYVNRSYCIGSMPVYF